MPVLFLAMFNDGQAYVSIRQVHCNNKTCQVWLEIGLITQNILYEENV